MINSRLVKTSILLNGFSIIEVPLYLWFCYICSYVVLKILCFSGKMIWQVAGIFCCPVVFFLMAACICREAGISMIS